MPKKNKRSVNKDITRSVAPASTANIKPLEFNPDYSYVFKDLRRIGILAGTFVTVLIVLSFIIK